MVMPYLIIKKSIDCAHLIQDSDELITKKCSNKHGHTYNFEFFLDYAVLMKFYNCKKMVDFAKPSKDIDLILNQYDHKDISDLFGLYLVEELTAKIKLELMDLFQCSSQAVLVKVMETAKYGYEC